MAFPNPYLQQWTNFMAVRLIVKSHTTQAAKFIGGGTIKISPFLDLFCFDWLTPFLKLILSLDLNEIQFIHLQ
jgi:hypothetical protein